MKQKLSRREFIISSFTTIIMFSFLATFMDIFKKEEKHIVSSGYGSSSYGA